MHVKMGITTFKDFISNCVLFSTSNLGTWESSTSHWILKYYGRCLIILFPNTAQGIFPRYFNFKYLVFFQHSIMIFLNSSATVSVYMKSNFKYVWFTSFHNQIYMSQVTNYQYYVIGMFPPCSIQISRHMTVISFIMQCFRPRERSLRIL